MAVCRVSVFRRLAAEEGQKLLEAVHASLVEVLQVPPDDPTVWISVQPDALARLPGRFGSELTFVEVVLFAGRTNQTKRKLHETIASKLEAAGVPRSSVLVVLNESPPENWSIAGVAQDQVDVGFRITI